MKILFLLGFSCWLMWSSFSVDSKNHVLQVGSKVWSDFAAHIPLIRSFSMGDNWPPQYPLFSGPPNRYHFFFYWGVGKLESLGLPLDWALNLPSAMGYFLILMAIYGLAKLWTKDRRVAWLSMVFFVLDGTLAWIQYFDKKGWTLQTLWGIPKNTEFAAMGPWDGGSVLAFWHLNTYTNQRHLTFAMGLVLISFLFFERLRRSEVLWSDRLWSFLAGIFLGVLPFLNRPAFLMFLCVLFYLFVFKTQIRKLLLVCGLGAVFSLAWVFSLGLPWGLGASGSLIQWFPGFAIHDRLNVVDFFHFFTMNFGFHFLLLGISVWAAPKELQRALLPSALLFGAAFFFKYSDDVLANHKFINFILIFVGICSAHLLVKTVDWLNVFVDRRWFPPSALVLFAIPFVFSGVINLFAQINETRFPIADVGSDPVATWIAENTDEKAVFLNAQYLYDPASLAGRNIFLGWAYFVGSLGFDWNERRSEMAQMFSPWSKERLCEKLRTYGLDFVEVKRNPTGPEAVRVDVDFFLHHFSESYFDPRSQTWIYEVRRMCSLFN